MIENGKDTEVFGPLPRDTDNAIVSIEYMIKRKRKVLQGMDSKTELSENEKIKIGAEYDFIKNVERLIQAFKRTFHANLGKIPPCDLDYEEAILGALMLQSIDGVQEAPIKQVKSFLDPEHFYSEAHSIIYRAIIDLFNAGQPIDMRTVKDRLRKTGQLEAIGGPYKLAELTDKVSSASSMDYWGRVLVDFAIKRQLILVCSGLLHKLYDFETDPHDLLDEAKEEFKNIDGWIK